CHQLADRVIHVGLAEQARTVRWLQLPKLVDRKRPGIPQTRSNREVARQAGPFAQVREVATPEIDRIERDQVREGCLGFAEVVRRWIKLGRLGSVEWQRRGVG